MPVIPCLALVVWIAAHLAVTGPAAAAARRPEIFPADDVAAGMRGVGRTSLVGGELQDFDFEVLGVLRTFHPQGRIFLVRLEHPLLEESGVIAGMSGSPLFIDDKLLGAVAYGFRYSRKPIAGVTPAAEMLIPVGMAAGDGGAVRAAKSRAVQHKQHHIHRLWQEHIDGALDPQALRSALMEAFVSAPWRHGLREFEGWAVEAAAGMPAGSGARLQPLPTPLSISGARLDRLGDVASLMQPGGLMAVQAPRAPADAQDAPPDVLLPGQPIGAVLMRGDIDIAGMGTLTFIDGNRVAAFGHPLMGAGDTDLPLALGHVEAIIPSRLLSFRLTSSRRIIGSIVQDRTSAIVGELGREAPMFPATVAIRGAHDAVYRYELAGHWQFAPLMSLYAAALSAIRWDGLLEEMTVEASSRIRIRGREEPLVLENIYLGYNPIWPAFELVLLPVQSLMFNPFETVEIESLDVDYNITGGITAAFITEVQVERLEVRPGDTLRLQVALQEFHGPEHIQEIALDIPDDAEPGRTARIYVADSTTATTALMARDPGLLRPRSLDDLIAMLSVLPDNRGLYVWGDFVRRGLRYAGARMPALPGSVVNMLEHGTVAGRTAPLIEDVAAHVITPQVILGARTIQIKIMERE